MDLPGKENIYETFTTDIGEQKTNKSYENVRDSKTIDTGKIFKCISPKSKYLGNINYNMFMAMAYLNPMSLLTLKPIDAFITRKYFTILQNEPTWTFMSNGKNHTGDEKAGFIEIYNDKTNIFGVEILKNIIDTNDFSKLEEIYQEIFEPIPENDLVYVSGDNIEKYKCSTKHYTLAPFEGYYINENIIGLLSTLLNKLGLNKNKDFVEEQVEIYLKNKQLLENFTPEVQTSIIQQKDTTTGRSINAELKCQVYFFRNIIRYYDIQSNYQYKEKAHRNVNDIYRKRFPTKNVYGHDITDTFITLNQDKTLEYWIKDTYDYNKTFKSVDPPIATFLAPYFDIITNFYVFYVVSNMNKDKCEKQIKLIADSKNFLTRLATYDPLTHDAYKKDTEERKVYTGRLISDDNNITKINMLEDEKINKINEYEKLISNQEQQKTLGDNATEIKSTLREYINFLIEENILEKTQMRHYYKRFGLL